MGEMYHLSVIARFTFASTQRKAEDLKQRAIARAKELEARAYKERKMIDPHAQQQPASPLRLLLQTSAVNLGLLDLDTSSYEDRLNAEFIFREQQLKGKDIDFLSRFMPYGLAEEVHQLMS